MALLTTENLTRSFGEFIALDSVSINVEDGEALAMIGPNGAGKTTFFNLISGLLQPTSGVITFNEEDITGLDAHEVAKRGCSRSFQTIQIFPELSVLENLRLIAQVSSPRRRSLHIPKEDLGPPLERARELLEILNIAALKDRKAAEISHGQKRTSEVGLSLATNPQILLLDEPTAGMSQQETAEIAELFDELKADYTMFLVEHDIDFVRDFAERVIVLHKGRIIADGSPDAIANDAAVQKAYLGSEANL